MEPIYRSPLLLLIPPPPAAKFELTFAPPELIWMHKTCAWSIFLQRGTFAEMIFIRRRLCFGQLNGLQHCKEDTTAGFGGYRNQEDSDQVDNRRCLEREIPLFG